MSRTQVPLLLVSISLLCAAPAASGQSVASSDDTGRAPARRPVTSIELPGSPAGSPMPEVVEICRDEYGVPHVFAASDLGAAYGVGYACAEDRFMQMTYHRLSMQGRLAEFLGKGAGDAYLNHDSQMRLINYALWARRIVDDLRASPTGSDKRRTYDMLLAYSQGVNFYASGSPDLPALYSSVGYSGFPTPGAAGEDWRPEDSILMWMRLSRLFTRGTVASMNGMVKTKHAYEDWGVETDPKQKAMLAAQLFPKRVFDPKGATVPSFPIGVGTGITGTDEDDAMDWFAMETSGCPPAPSAPAPFSAPGGYYGNRGHLLAGSPPQINDAPHLLGRFDGGDGGNDLAGTGDKFSEAFAITMGGRAYLYGGPKIKLFEPNEMWEVHFVCPSFDVRGATIPGSLNVLVGSNRNADDSSVAWTVTSANASQGDVVELSVTGSTYLYDGGARPISTIDEVVLVTDPGDGQVTSDVVHYREALDWGPLLTRGAGDVFLLPDCQAGEEYAFKWLPFFQDDPDPSKGFRDPTTGFLAM